MIEPHRPLTICDLTQSYAPSGGGGITTYLREKRSWMDENSQHELVQIVPGPADKVTKSGRHTFIEVGSEILKGNKKYRFITRTGAVRQLLEEYRPDLIESQCPWVLPWTAIRYRRHVPETTLVAGYHTDFPTAQIERVASAMLGPRPGRLLKGAALFYAGRTYREFDGVYALSQSTRQVLVDRGIENVSLLDLGVNKARFGPDKADPAFRAELGLKGKGPLLLYAGRLDAEKRPATVIRAARLLPPELDASLVIIGEGRQLGELQELAKGLDVAFPGFIDDRDQLARAFASCDIYVSGMADETFGISVIEAQASGLPVVGVALGAMPERVPPEVGLLGPRDDAEAMAANILKVWHGDRAAMGQAARRLVEARYDWAQTFEALFDTVYPAAFEKARARQERRGVGERISTALPRLRDRRGAGSFGLR